MLKAPALKSLGLYILGLQDRPDRGSLHMFQNVFEKSKNALKNEVSKRSVQRASAKKRPALYRFIDPNIDDQLIFLLIFSMALTCQTKWLQKEH